MSHTSGAMQPFSRLLARPRPRPSCQCGPHIPGPEQSPQLQALPAISCPCISIDAGSNVLIMHLVEALALQGLIVKSISSSLYTWQTT